MGLLEGLDELGGPLNRRAMAVPRRPEIGSTANRHTVLQGDVAVVWAGRRIPTSSLLLKGGELARVGGSGGAAHGRAAVAGRLWPRPT